MGEKERKRSLYDAGLVPGDWKVSWDDFWLTVSAMFAPPMPVSIQTHADQPLPLHEVLGKALESLGLEEHLVPLYQAIRDLSKPHFEQAIAEFEQIRQDLDGEES